MQLWQYNKATGYWVHVRAVTRETAAQWLAVFQQDAPGEVFKIAASKPRN